MIARVFMIMAVLIVGPAWAQGDSLYELADRGYKAYAAGDYEAAAKAFEAVLEQDPAQPSLAAQLAYAYKADGKSREAARWFRHAIRHTEGKADYGMRREVEVLENRFDMSAYLVWRENALDGNDLAAVGPSLTQSQGGTELAWTPPGIGYRDGRLFQVFGRFLWGFEADTFNIQRDSYQAGAGVRYRPFKRHNVVLSAERLIAIGDFARDDWMLRASYSWDRGFAYQPDRNAWTYTTLYLDAALIDPAHPDLFLMAEGRYGRSFRLAGSEYGPGWVITPHLTVASVLQDDSFHTTTLIEAGPGASLKLWFADTPMRAHAASAELLVQWRGKITGDSAGPSGFIATFVIRY